MVISLSWEDTGQILSNLADRVRRHGIPEVIVAVQRGGLVPGVVLSHHLDVRHFLSFNITRTAHDGINAKKVAPTIGPNISFTTLAGKDVLLVDDIAGTGMTLTTVQKVLNTWSPLRIRSLVCVVNLNNWDGANVKEPPSVFSYIGKEVRGWVIFPWEREQYVAHPSKTGQVEKVL